MKTIRVTVAGASGRMGRTLIRALAESQDMQLVFALERGGHADLGRDAGALAGLPAADIPLTDDLVTAASKSDAVLDFTSPAASVALSEIAAPRDFPMPTLRVCKRPRATP
jgi:4-hydroxy-tetrahydrodipicolinate reductase